MVKSDKILGIVLKGLFWKWLQILVVCGVFCNLCIWFEWLGKNWRCVWTPTCERKGRFHCHLFWLNVCVCRFFFIGIRVILFVNGPGDLDRVISKTQKIVSDASLLNTLHDKVQIKAKWSNQGKGLVHSPTLPCCSYWKGSLQVVLDYGRPTYKLCIYLSICFIFIYIYIL